jgi:hypothetical protein
MTLLTKPVVRESFSSIRGRHVVVVLEPTGTVLVRLKGEGHKGERYRFTVGQLFYLGARRAADEALRARGAARRKERVHGSAPQ